jgi:hypothetical protein
MWFLNALLQVFVFLHQVLRKTLSNLLNFLSRLDQTARSVLRAVSEFSWRLGRVMLSIGWTMAKLLLFYVPGLVLAIGFRSNTALLVVGIAYMVLVTAVGIFYRPETDAERPVRVNATWLSFFPLGWSHDPDFGPILAEFTATYDDLRLSQRNADSDLLRKALRRIVERLEHNMKWTSGCVRKAIKLRQLQSKLQDDQMIADLEGRIARVKERLNANLEQFRHAKTALAEVNVALDEQEHVIDSLNPVEDEVVLLEQFKKVLRSHQETLRLARTS